MKKIILAIVILVVLIFGAYEYLTRPALLPSKDINEVVPKPDLNKGGETSAASPKIYKIDQSKSKAEFGINEVLRGSQFVARGTTNQMGGDILISNGQLNFSEIKINARTFKTDDAKRDGAINRMILKTDSPENEFITFVPDMMSGVGYKITGSEFDLDVKGSLTISSMTQAVVVPLHIIIGDDSVIGSTQFRIKRSDFNLKIPSLSFIASVDDEFPVYVDFVANLVK